MTKHFKCNSCNQIIFKKAKITILFAMKKISNGIDKLCTYRISANKCSDKYSFLNLQIEENFQYLSQYLQIHLHKIFFMRHLFKGENYLQKFDICIANTNYLSFLFQIYSRPLEFPGKICFYWQFFNLLSHFSNFSVSYKLYSQKIEFLLTFV